MNSNINWIEYNKENLLREYSNYIAEIEYEKGLHIVTNVLCLVKYKKTKN